jgi:hypothetical protein
MFLRRSRERKEGSAYPDMLKGRRAQARGLRKVFEVDKGTFFGPQAKAEDAQGGVEVPEREDGLGRLSSSGPEPKTLRSAETVRTEGESASR